MSFSTDSLTQMLAAGCWLSEFWNKFWNRLEN